MPAFGDWDSVVQVSGSDATTSNTSATDITGLTFAAVANGVYEVEAFLIASSSDASGCKYAVGFSSAGALGSAHYIGCTTNKSSGVNTFSGINVLETTAFFTLGGSTKCFVKINVTVVAGANPGNITIQHAKVTSGTATVYIGSIMKIKRGL